MNLKRNRAFAAAARHEGAVVLPQLGLVETVAPAR